MENNYILEYAEGVERGRKTHKFPATNNGDAVLKVGVEIKKLKEGGKKIFVYRLSNPKGETVNLPFGF